MIRKQKIAVGIAGFSLLALVSFGVSTNKFDGLKSNAFAATGYNLTVTVVNKGSATGSISGAEGPYLPGTVVRLTANTPNGTIINGWGGACTGRRNYCDVVMDKNQTVKIQFGSGTTVTPPPSNTNDGWKNLTVNKTGSGEVTDIWSNKIEGTSKKSAGTKLVLVAVPSAGYIFDGWEGEKCQGQGYLCEFFKGATDDTVNAKFIQNASNKVSVIAVSARAYLTNDMTGTITGVNNLYAIGDTVTITAVPLAGKTFEGWYPYTLKNGIIETNSGASKRSKCYGQGSTCTFIADKNGIREIAVIGDTKDATDRDFSVYYRPQGNGSGTVVDGKGVTYVSGQSYPTKYFDKVSFTATPNADSVFAGWNYSGCKNQGTVCEDIVVGWFDLTPVFNLKTGGTGTGTGTGTETTKLFNLTASRRGAGTGILTPSGGTYPAGTSVTITATPTGGSTFGGWGGACTGRKETCTVKMDSNLTVFGGFNAPASSN